MAKNGVVLTTVFALLILGLYTEIVPAQSVRADTSSYDSQAADKQCPQPTTTTGYAPGLGKQYTDCNTGSTAAAVFLAVDACVTKTNLYGQKCTGTANSGGGISVVGYCLSANKCKATQWSDQEGTLHTISDNATNVAQSQSSSGSVSVTPDKPIQVACDAAGCPVTQSSQTPVSDNNSSSPYPTTQSGSSGTGASNAPSTPSSASGGVSQTPTAPVSTTNSPAATVPSSVAPTAPSSGATPAPSTPVFSGSPTLGNIATQPIVPSSGLSLPSSGVVGGFRGGVTTAFSPTRATFNSGAVSRGFQRNAPLSPVISAINNFSVNAVFGFFTGLLSAVATQQASQAPGQNVIVNQIVVQQTPNVPLLKQIAGVPQISTVSHGGVGVQLSPSIAPLKQSQSSSQAQLNSQNPSSASLLSILSGAAPAVTPGSIVDIVQGANIQTQAEISASPQILDLPENQAVLALQASTTSQGLRSTVLSESVNALENDQTIPEQFFITEQSLADAQSNYQWLLAQIDAWRTAQSAGVCDANCENALSLLQNALPKQQAQVRQLQALVDQGPQAFAATSTASTTTSAPTFANNPPVITRAPGAGQESVVSNQASTLQTAVPAAGAPFYVKQNDNWCDQYGDCIPAKSFESSPAQHASIASNIQLVASSSGVAPSAAADPVGAIVHTVQHLVQNVLSLFTPNPTSSGEIKQCSLFKSLFGGCGSTW